MFSQEPYPNIQLFSSKFIGILDEIIPVENR